VITIGREQLVQKEREGAMMPGHENWNDELQGAAMNQSPATGGAPTNNAGPVLRGPPRLTTNTFPCGCAKHSI